MRDRTAEIITALESHRELIIGAISYRMKEAYSEEYGRKRARAAVKGFVKNNAAHLDLGDVKRLCVCWEDVVDHFSEAKI